MGAVLSFRDLCVARGDRIVVRGVSATLEPGEMLHVAGPNGSGKTTLLQVLAGLRIPESGAIVAPPPEALHWIGHRHGLNPVLSPRENLRFWCALQGATVATLPGAIERLRLTRVADRPCRELSAGQTRRVALARLLLAPRRLWLLDEPLSALDREGSELLGEMLRAQAQGGGAVVVTSHQALPDLPRLRRLELGA